MFSHVLISTIGFLCSSLCLVTEGLKPVTECVCAACYRQDYQMNFPAFVCCEIISAP